MDDGRNQQGIAQHEVVAVCKALRIIGEVIEGGANDRLVLMVGALEQ
jgi:hypothetical protein